MVSIFFITRHSHCEFTDLFDEVVMSFFSSWRSVDYEVMLEMVGSGGMMSITSSANRARSSRGSLSLMVNMFLWMDGGSRW